MDHQKVRTSPGWLIKCTYSYWQFVVVFYETVDTELRQTHLNALERATIVKTINTAKTLGGPV